MEKDVTVDDEALTYLRKNGFSSVPVTKIGDQHVVGYRPDSIKALLAEE